MSWTYSQSTGQLSFHWKLFTVGYSGNGAGKNNPAMQNVSKVGPLPQGEYTISPAYTHPHLGPLTMNLIPDSTNEMFGRALFRIHPDSIAHPGEASEGCIVIPNHEKRAEIAASPDRHLTVIA